MGPQVIASLVKAGAPEHAGHTQEFIEFDGIDKAVRLNCSCGVGLTIDIPKTPAPSESLPEFVREAFDPRNAPKKGKGDGGP